MELEGIWAEHESSVRAFVRSRVSNVADADDVVQEVLVKIFKSLETVDSEESVKAWLFQVTRRTIIDHYRTKRPPQSDECPEETAAPIDDEEVQRALSQCVRPFIDALPDEDRALLMAIDIEGRSQKEYAAEMGISYSTLKSRVHRSRARLRALFDKCCRFSRDGRGTVADFDRKTNSCEGC